MSRYTLIVKGPIPVATKAARDRGFDFIIGTHESIPGRETVLVLDIPRWSEPRLHGWLCSEPHLAPYPDGTLLTFVSHNAYHGNKVKP
jgi:hypothetical protein